ncbi:ABC transporter transmembrane domain-containing protein [Streptomyces sp. NPDC057499]|uniref:ABC transporter transmembrane domain-containing protein n=1 Tax=Streptomyces sp. NPDC057499 TaxID=3346150 RepID=UPI00368BAE21
MVGLTLPPYLLSRAIDDGLRAGSRPALAGWVAALLGVGVLNAWLAIMRHRTMTRVRLDAVLRSVRAVVAQSTRLGAELPRRVTAGEVVTIGFGDVAVIAMTLTITGPGVGAVVAFVVVAGLLLAVAPLLAAVVLLGVPLLMVLVGPLLGRLQGVEAAYRERQGLLAGRFEDMVGGLRVLNGIGGKEVYAERYRRGSRELREEGYRVGAVTSWIRALGVGLPTLFLGSVTWLGARMAAEGAISVGELVAVYGYAAVLVVPVEFFIEGGYDLSRGLVAARRVIRFLSLEPGSGNAEGAGPGAPAVLRDPESGVEVVPERLTALAGARPEDSAAVVERLGRFTGSAATWGDVRLDEIDLTRVRRRVLVADNDADLFAGPLREVVGGARDRDARALDRALYAAVAQDIVRGLPDGLDARVEARGGNLSGGQRQRVRLARALLADPEVLLAVEPTSAVDAHTEAAMADRLRTARSGRTTLVTSTSPLVLDRADTVYYLVDGVVAAVGSHRELLEREPGYRRLVSRGTDDDGTGNDGTDDDGTDDDGTSHDGTGNDPADHGDPAGERSVPAYGEDIR